MPWKESNVLDQRVQLISEYLKGEVPLAGLCRVFGISRKTGYKFIGRYREEGAEGLEDRSRAPHRQCNALSEGVREVILEVRKAHPTWGPRKLLAWLRRERPRIAWPVASTIGALLSREGLAVRKRRRPRATPSPHPLSAASVPNSVWCADFKGWFRTRDGERCTPFTLIDAHSRYLLRCQALTTTDITVVKPLMEAAFREYGLPAVIRTDNGPPFATKALGGLSRMAVWWLKLGITPERIAPGRPEENGRQERLHRTLKEDLLRQPAWDATAQQRVFQRYLHLYNHDRPHEALGYQTPSQLYLPSPHRYPDIVSNFTYPNDFTVRHVRHTGEMRWRGNLLFVSEVLIGEAVGLLPISEQHWALYVGPLPLAILDDATRSWLSQPKARPILQTLLAESNSDLAPDEATGKPQPQNPNPKPLLTYKQHHETITHVLPMSSV